MFKSKEPAQVIWTRFSDYYKVCDTSAMRGGTYAFVFNKTKPNPWEMPCEFERCVYIGESAGNYVDRQNPGKNKDRSHIHKRMTRHHKPLTTGEGGDTSHQKIIEEYGYGDAVINGTLTGVPLWLCLLIPRLDVDDYAVKAWVQYQERLQIYEYICTFGRSPLGNMDCDTSKNPNSHSSKTLANRTSLDEFMNL